MSFLQFHHCKPLAGIWGAQQPQQDSSKHNFSSYNLPPLIIPSSNEASSSPPASPASSQSFSSASSSSSASPVTLPSASLYTKRDIWGSFSIADSEPVFNYNLPTKSNEFHLTPLNEMYDRIPFDPLSTSSSTSEFSVFSPTNVIQNQYSPNHEYFEPLNPMNAYTDSLIESPIDSIPSTPISDSSFDSMVSSPITPVDSPIHSHHTNHIHNHIKHSDSINTSTPTTSTNNRKKSRKSDIKINKKKLSVNTELYKTELCATFVKSGGYCPYGDKCQFAHGSTELKSVDRPSNWRSKPCQNWLKTGTCAYNERCCFRHD